MSMSKPADSQSHGPVRTIHCSVIVSVLESYEIVRRQCLHWDHILPSDWEVILLDDGSVPPIPIPVPRPTWLTLAYTRSTIPWTQPLARNLGARLARGKYLLLTDIDHVVSQEAVSAIRGFCGPRMLFPREYGVLDAEGAVHQDEAALRAIGWTSEAEGAAPAVSVHQNTFAIRREIFLDEMRGGYDESLCGNGKYGGDDVEFNDRYRQLIQAGRVEPDRLGPRNYVYPDPATSAHFHTLARD